MLILRQDQNTNNISRYVKGLDKLLGAESETNVMKKVLIDLQPKLKVSTEETEVLIVKVKKEQIGADIQRELCDKEAAICGIQRDEANNLKDECQTELAKVEPILEAALKNLGTIDRKSIDFIKSMGSPPPAISKLFKALVITWEIKNVPMVKDPEDNMKKIADYKTPAKTQILNKPDNLLKALKAFDEEKIMSMNPTTIKHLRDMFDNDPEFTIEKLGNAAEAAKLIGMFMAAVVEVYDKLLIINPKREQLKGAEEALVVAESILKEKKDALQEVEDMIAKLQKELDDAMANK
jgi:dynein heavy chain